MKSVYPENAPILGDRGVTRIHDFDNNKNDKYAVNMDIQKPAPKEAIFDELESIVRIKSERIEEEYTSRISKLR